MTTLVDVVVIGAGQAGLSSAHFLRRAGLDHVVLDADARPGGAWQHRWPTLRMATVNAIHDLPGMPLRHVDPEAPAAEVVPAYFAEFERREDLRVLRPVRVHAVRSRPDGRLLVETDAGAWAARALINATGTWTRPFWPRYPGQETFRGRQLHTADYRRPEEFAGEHVVVVGGGISAVGFLLELEGVATTTWFTRRPPVFVDGEFTSERGRAAVALVEERVRNGLPPASVVSVTGLPNTPEVAAARARGLLVARPVFDRVTPDGVAVDGGELRAGAILWATGFRPAVEHLAPLRLRGPGGGIALDGTRVVADPRVHLVGYGPSASTVGATRAGRVAVREVRALLGPAFAG
ncbi:FAD-dependent oxidoreductase [Umezawaea beigongshangensis]|uniref:FAD-dependent oxidoreductase n=1 Tax=Umezawaea beigongshangensis TaxID=2780383 RepID=UPI0018F23A45|nr:FAD-dependent oxidoreductase [Umezawaea beigongshangensis]